jgi:hypothetical protein
MKDSWINKLKKWWDSNLPPQVLKEIKSERVIEACRQRHQYLSSDHWDWLRYGALLDNNTRYPVFSYYGFDRSFPPLLNQKALNTVWMLGVAEFRAGGWFVIKLKGSAVIVIEKNKKIKNKRGREDSCSPDHKLNIINKFIIRFSQWILVFLFVKIIYHHIFFIVIYR